MSVRQKVVKTAADGSPAVISHDGLVHTALQPPQAHSLPGADHTGVLSETKGGTNQSSYATGDMLYANGANTLAKRAIGTANDVLTVIAGIPTWQAPTGGSAHNMFSTTHSDSVAAAAIRGGIMRGNATPAWAVFLLGGTGTYLRSDGTDLLYATIPSGDLGTGTADATTFLQGDRTWAIPPGLNVTRIAGNSGAANTAASPSETWQILTADATANATTTLTTVMTTTGLAIGTYYFKYIVIWQSATVTVGVNFAVDYTGTVTRVRATRTYRTTGAAAATGVSDLVAATLTGQLVEHMSTRSDAGSLGPNTGVDTINADQYDIIEGIIVVSTSANLLLQHASETATSTQVMADTHLVLRRLA